jgi:hypothetical protein
MPAPKPPEAWFWSYDIDPTDLDSVLLGGVRLARLSSYRKGAAPRLAALIYQDGGPARHYALGLDAAAALARVRDTGERPVAITAAPGDDAARFSLVTEAGPGPVSTLHLDLDEAGLRALCDDKHAIADLATYTAGGARRYAAVIEERAQASWLFTGVTAKELDAKVLEHGAALVKVRPYVEGGRQLFAAVAERLEPGPWAWYAFAERDTIAKKLDENRAYPVDLDVTRDEAGLRFTVVMYRNPRE